MFYEINDTLINLDKIYYIQKKEGFILEIHFDDSKLVGTIEFTTESGLNEEYNKIKEKLKEIYG